MEEVLSTVYASALFSTVFVGNKRYRRKESGEAHIKNEK